MSNYESYCEHCGAEITYGNHATWCREEPRGVFDKEREIARLLVRHEDRITARAFKELRREIALLMTMELHWHRATAPWSKEQKAWFDENGKRRETAGNLSVR